MEELDTTSEARAVQLAAYRSMSGPDRLRLGFQLSEDVGSLTDAGVAARERSRSDQ